MQLLYTRLLGASSSAVAAALMLAGCGGGSSSNSGVEGPFTVDASITNSDILDSKDDRYYDIFQVDVVRNGRAQVAMSSSNLDSQIYVYLQNKNDKNKFDLVYEDDDSGGGSNAVINFDVKRSETYRVTATSARSREFGDYTIFFSRELSRPLVPLLRQSAGFALPPMKAKGAVEKQAKE